MHRPDKGVLAAADHAETDRTRLRVVFSFNGHVAPPVCIANQGMLYL
jgi:hypothetical protein